jgi:HPt (histidine-containing phosphotransfer) domain-containing protein
MEGPFRQEAAMVVLDLDQLKTMTGGDADLAVEALGIFRSQAELWSRMLDAHTDPDHWADAAHAIKGAALSVGLVPLGDACHAAETLGRSGQATPAKAGVAISAVKDRLGEAIEAIAHVEHQLMMRRTFVGVRVE